MEKKKEKDKIKIYKDDYDDDNIPEIDLPKTTDVIPDEVPRRDGPGGEQDTPIRHHFLVN